MANNSLELVQRIEYLKDVCAGKKVFHLGCTNYPFTAEILETGRHLHLQLEKVASELYGLDYDQQGLDEFSGRGIKNLYQGDLEKLEDVDLNETFDVIIAGEMIEHLNNPGLFLNGVKRFMNADTKLVITTINAYCALRFAMYLLAGRGGKQEPVHPDHVAYYSYSTLSLLLKRHNLAVNDFLFYDLGLEHRGGKWYFNLLNDVSVKVGKQFADGLIAVCGLEK